MKTPSILSTIQQLRALLTRKEKIEWLGILVFAFCTGFLEIFTALVIIVFVQVLNQPKIGLTYLAKVGIVNGFVFSEEQLVFYAAVFLGIVYLVKNGIAALEVFYQNFTIQRMNSDFKSKLLHRYSCTDYGFYLTRNSSLGIQVISSDVELVFAIALIAVAGLLSESVVAFCLLGVLVYMNPFLALMILSVSAVFGFFVAKGLFPLLYRWGQVIQTASLQSVRNLMQFFHGFKEIVISGHQDSFMQAYRHHIYKKSRLQAIQTATNALPRMAIEVLFMGLLVGTIAFLCLGHAEPAQIMAILSGYLYAGFRLMPGLNRILGHLSVFKAQSPSIERVYAEYNAVPMREVYCDAPNFAFDQSIDLNQVSFRYLNAHDEALRSISLKLKKGECVGIVGETGSGKSTLVDVILGLLQPQRGTVLIDGQFSAYSHQWHHKIGYVPQAIYLTDDTIAANIAFGERSIDDARLKDSIEAAQLTRFIVELPDGVKTIVGERGVRLSGGEQQRIAIARALYRNPAVLIFDEATSALDNDTESRLMETIYRVSQHRTVIMIAHRITTLKQCDRILVMEKGEIKDITTYQDLQNSQDNRQ
ncbi:MAG: ABC transporter ATP-binding protein [Legionellales bacterium RIFCSPHIGHO2_12_FULL_42_9]|nr:MAG: ABC transporter ATP-binding protein [Legionellales bacterium RIFCSPHIGHO2_12_FULL_42_9]